MPHNQATEGELQEPLDPIAVLANPATSYWLRNAIVSAFERDPFDAERDALALASILTKRVDELVERHFSTRR
jgi:hypothetical protein